ncbi:hypothetical protein [uncultured Imperialibacter sp.]|uniref:hypothetical protein n=1 Tax=uncultured Imperialibacter sp. TaxID=1672639 RepID=UPI0030D7559F|tara:strand:+ start:974 stop:1621 length:648 start_codon:yes stop_codon:yes gene_type:complete
MQLSKERRQELLDEWFSFGTGQLFAVICVVTLILLFIKKSFIEGELAAFEILQERGEMGFFHALSAVQYLTVPIVYAWKFTVTAFILYVGGFMFGYKLTFKDMWRLALAAELVFFIPELIKIAWFLVVNTDPTYQEIGAFYPLSMMNLFDFESLAPRWHYPLKALNLFEVVYWIALAAGVYVISGKQRKNSIIIVATSYVLWFFLWIGFYLIIYK